MRYIIGLAVILAVMLASGCAKEEQKDYILDVRAVINKRPAEVVRILGEPDTTYTERILGQEIFCQRYQKHNIEIQYPNTLSTDIVIYGPHGLPFTQSALAAFNIDYHKQHPSQMEKDRLLRWYDFGEFAAISFYNTRRDSTGRVTDYTIFFKAKESDSAR